MSSPSSFTGGCECGKVKYTFTSEPVHASLCYCTDCMRSTGSTHAHSLLVPKASFASTGAAEPRTYARASDAGAAVRGRFCGGCGTTVWCESRPADGRGVVAVRAGTLDDPRLNARWRPATELYCRNKYGWFATFGVEGARAFEGMVGEAEVGEVMGKVAAEA